MPQECDGKICKTCGDVQVKILEKYEEDDVDLMKIARYLGWAYVSGSNIDTTVVSRDRLPHVKINTLHRNIVLVSTMRSKKFSSHFGVVTPAEKTVFRTFQRIKSGKVIKKVKEVTIVSPNGSQLMLSDELPQGFNSFLGTPKKQS